jgi:hypothetical protein
MSRGISRYHPNPLRAIEEAGAPARQASGMNGLGSMVLDRAP